MLYNIITIAYLASLAFIFVRFPNYVGVVLTTMLFWLSVRGVVYEKFLVGASIPFIPVQGKGVRVLSAVVLVVAVYFYYLLFSTSALGLQLWAVGLIFIYLPGIMALGMFLKKKQTNRESPKLV